MTEHDCAQIEELISARMDRATSPEENAHVERHLDDCAACQATAQAFERVDREVGAYLRATPVPAIDTPWREAGRAPIVVRRLLARWRPATIALTTILVLVVASVLAFGAFRGNMRTVQETSAPQSAYTTGGAAPSTADSRAPTAAAAVPSSAPSRATAAAPNAAPSTAPAAGARATAASGGSAAAASSAPQLGAGNSPTAINPVQQLRLATATMLAVCQPDCSASPQGAQTLTEVVALLDRPLARVSPATATAATGAATTVLRFTLADGQQVELRYSPEAEQLGLPDGTLLLAPSALRDVLTAPVRLP